MARRKRKRSGISSYFRQVFTDHPEWLNEKSNDPILEKYRLDHGLSADSPVDKSVKSALANIKSIMRKKGRDRGKPKAAPRANVKLGTLEEMIDDCLTVAKTLDRVGLDEIIHTLRRARNQVVWKIGE